MVSDWVEKNKLSFQCKRPLLLAIVFLFIYIAAVVIGSAIQDALQLGLSMGWFQQVFGLFAAIIFSLILREPRNLLGLNAPTKNWLVPTITIGLSITFLGHIVASVLLLEPSNVTPEYLLYQATAPGLGEEFGLRGPWIALLGIAVSRSKLLNTYPSFFLLLAAIPFALLHLLEMSGIKLICIFFFTLYAGVVLGWLRMHFSSIWPAVIAHNIANFSSSLV